MVINQKETQRQAPKHTKYTANKNYNDIIYCYLQVNCETIDIPGKKDKIKRVFKKKLNFTQIGKECKISRHTVKNRIDKLVELGLLIEEETYYDLVTLPKEEAFLLSLSTMRFLVNTAQDHVISICIYLLNRFIANGQRPFSFYVTDLKRFIGMSTTNRHSTLVIGDSLAALRKLGLIDYKIITHPDKTEYRLYGALNHIPAANEAECIK